MLEAIDHVGIAVRDLDTALSFYVGVLGMSLTDVEVNEEQGVREATLSPGGASAAEGVATVQLLAPLAPDSPIARFLDRRGEGVQQVAYRVRDVAAAAQTLRERGLTLLYDEAKPGSRGSLVNFVHPRDAGGVLLELVQLTQQELRA